MKGFLNYVPGNSFFHTLNPLTKLIMAFLICICCFVSDSLIFLAAMIVLNLAIAHSAGIFKRGTALLKGLSQLSLFIFILQVLFVRDGNPVIMFPFNFAITDYGISLAFLVALRLLGATMPLAIMLSVTQMNDLSNVLVEKVGIPYKYAFTLTTAMRFIPIFSDEMSGIMEAQVSRGVEIDTKNFLKKMSLILPLCLPLLITSVKKIEGSAISAEMRGFNLRTRHSCYKKYPIKIKDITVISISIALVVLAALLNGVIR